MTELMGTAVRLSASLDALATLTAWLRVETEEIEIGPEMRAALAAVAAELLGDAHGEIEPAVAQQVVGMTRAFLRQAIDLVEDPGRTGGWAHVDPALLQGIGRLSGAIAGAIAAAGASLDGLARGLGAPGGKFLDVGTGTAWLAIAMARANPNLDIVGLDVFEPPLELARRNVDDAGLTSRIELRRGDVGELADDGEYDAVWLPLPFLPRAVIPEALDAARRSLKPGGWLLPGAFAGPPDQLSELLVDLRTFRSGGHPWRPAEIQSMLVEHGFVDVCEVLRSWPAPVRLFAGRRIP